MTMMMMVDALCFRDGWGDGRAETDTHMAGLESDEKSLARCRTTNHLGETHL